MQAELAPRSSSVLTHAQKARRVAQSFYGALVAEGFTSEQIVCLAGHLLEHVADESRSAPQSALAAK